MQFHTSIAGENVPLRVLVVDDYEPFRRAVRLILQLRDDIKIIAEASDGLEAIQKTLDLQPDLVLLDIGLPGPNGIQVARRLRDLVPRAHVLFLSAESSSDVVQEALNAGGVGYVCKLDAASELLPAIEMFRRGKLFVSRNLEHYERRDFRDGVPRDKSMPALQGFCHEAAFYADDASFIGGFTRFIEASLEVGNVVLVVVTESHRRQIDQRLQGHGLDVGDLLKQESYFALDANDALSLFMINDWPDRVRFATVANDLLNRVNKTANKRHRRVAACGELAPTLWKQGNGDAAVRLEQLWDEIARSHSVDTLCGYVSASPHRERQLQTFKDICSEHTAAYFR